MESDREMIRNTWNKIGCNNCGIATYSDDSGRSLRSCSGCMKVGYCKKMSKN